MVSTNSQWKLAIFLPLMVWFAVWFQHFQRKSRTENRKDDDYAAFVNELRLKKSGTDRIKVRIYRLAFYGMIIYEFFSMSALALTEGELLQGGNGIDWLGVVNLEITSSEFYKLTLALATWVYLLLAYLSAKKWHRIPMKNPIFTATKGLWATILAEMMVIPVANTALKTTECSTAGTLIIDSSIECWSSPVHGIMLFAGIGLVIGIIPLSLYFAMHKNQFGTSGFYFLPEFNVAIVFCKITMTGFASASTSPLASSIFLFICFVLLLCLNYWKQPAMGASVKPNNLRTATFSVCAWSAMCAMWVSIDCLGREQKECTSGTVVIILVAVGIPLSIVAWYVNKPRAAKLAPQSLFEDNGAVRALTSSGIIENGERADGLALIDAIRGAKRGGTQMVMDLFANSTAKDMVQMLRVPDVDVLTVGCEVMAMLIIKDETRDEIKELGGHDRLFNLLEWDWASLRYNALRAILNLSFEKDEGAPTTVDLSRTLMEDNDLMAMSAYTSLEVLDLSGCNEITTGVGQAICSLPSLKALMLSRCQAVNDKHVVMFSKKLPGLTRLDIGDCFKVKNEGVKALGRLKELRFLSLTCVPAVQSSIRSLLSVNLEFEELRLSGTKCTDNCVEEMSKLTKLTHLELNDTGFGDPGLTKFSAKMMTGIVELSMARTFITDRGIQHIASNAASLTSLSVAGTNLTNAGVRCLENLRVTLTHLDLSDCNNLTFEGGEISGLTAMKWLDLSGSGVADDGVRFIAQMQTLQELNLSRTKITDASVACVCDSPQIFELAVTGCRYVSPRAMLKWEKVSTLRAGDPMVDEADDPMTDDMMPSDDQKKSRRSTTNPWGDMMDDGTSKKSRRGTKNPSDDQTIQTPVAKADIAAPGAWFDGKPAPSKSEWFSKTGKPSRARRKSLDQMSGGFFTGSAPKTRDAYFSGQSKIKHGFK